MQATGTPRWLRFVARALGGRSELRTLQDLRRLSGVGRFGLIFLFTILAPTSILAYLALRSVQNEELSVDADLARRADVVSAQIHRDFQEPFRRFERLATQRIVGDQDSVTNLEDLSPWLLAAYHFDGDENLVEPFALPDPPQPVLPSATWIARMREGENLEQKGRPEEAVSRYAAARDGTNDPTIAGEAAYARALALRAAGHVTESNDALRDVIGEYGGTRTTTGFRLGDLAQLKLAEEGLETDPDAGVVSLRGLVEDLSAAPWTIGVPGESAIARRALGRLEGRVDPDWLTRARARLAARTAQLYWSEYLYFNEISRWLPAARSSPEGQFQYLTSDASSALWASMRWNDEVYLYAFDQRRIGIELLAAAARADADDPDIAAVIAPPSLALPANSFVRDLRPWLPYHEIRVAPQDMDAIVQRKAQQRTTWLIVILLTIAIPVFGVVLLARMMGQELESARMKADFAANVSHELRSPITHIRLKGEALLYGLVEPGPDTTSHYEGIVRESERLSRLVDNVLDFAAIERGAKRYTFRPENLSSVLDLAVDTHRTAASDAQMMIDYDVPDDLPIVRMDREAVGQVLVNLLSNAVKYGSDGGWLGVRARAVDGGVQVEISDRGMGIAAEDLPKIFEHFFRSADPKVRRRKGTGIGLTIVRYIVEAHGGTIRVDSTPGRGTTFTVTLPLAPREAPGD